jgi:hypothetical protein
MKIVRIAEASEKRGRKIYPTAMTSSASEVETKSSIQITKGSTLTISVAYF